MPPTLSPGKLDALRWSSRHAALPSLLAVMLAACSPVKPRPPDASDGDGDLAAPPAADAAGPVDAAADLAGAAGCPRTPAPEDRARKVVISLPYDAAGAKAKVFAVLELGRDGALTPTAERFTMGRAHDDRVHFTPDGQIGLVVQEDGTIGVFRAPPAGQPGPVQVVHAAFKGAFTAARLTLDPAGERAYVVDFNTRENGGGLYSLRIGCDGSLSEEGKITAAQLPRALRLLGGGEALLAAPALLDSAAGETLHRAQLAKPPRRLQGVDAFGDGAGLVSAMELMPDGKFLLLGDNDEFSGTPNRVAVVALQPVLRRAQVLTPVNDPVDIVASPYGNAALAVSGYGNAVLRLGYDPQAAAPFTLRGEPTYQGKRPQLPSAAVLVQRGPLRGRVLLAENVGVRQLRFEPDGAVTDLGLTSSGSGLASIVGTVGVQP